MIVMRHSQKWQKYGPLQLNLKLLGIVSAQFGAAELTLCRKPSLMSMTIIDDIGRQAPQAIVEAIETPHMPLMPQVLLRLLRLLDEESPTLDQLTAVVSCDSALAARLLEILHADSPALPLSALNIPQALSRLGAKRLKTIATCLAIENEYVRAVDDTSYELKGYWRHSLLVAELSRSLAFKAGYPDPDEAYLTGLMHDVGELLVLSGLGAGYGLLLGICTDEEELCRLEPHYTGTDHAVAGALLVDRWKTPSFMADAILFHHRTGAEISETDALSRLLWAAHTLLAEAAGVTSSEADDRAIMPVSELTGLEPADLSTLLTAAEEAVSLKALELGLLLSPELTSLPVVNNLPHDMYLQQRASKDEALQELDARVRDMALLHPLQQRLLACTADEELYLVLREAAHVLFGLSRHLFLVARPELGVLAPVHLLGASPLLQKLSVPLAGAQSIVSAAFHQGEMHGSFDRHDETPLSLLDIQIARALQCEGILCIPLRGQTGVRGVMVCGLSRRQYEAKRKQLKWLAGFGKVAAASLETAAESYRRSFERENALKRNFERHSRKVVHEVSNPLGIINTYLAIVSGKLALEGGVQQELDVLKEEINRVQRIVQKMGELPNDEPAIETLQVNSLIEGMLALYGESLFSARGIVVEKELAPDIPLIRGEKDQIKQILINLWKNSSEALLEGGTIRISTRVIRNREGKDLVELQVCDTGPGLPPDVLDHLFQPLDPLRRPGHSGVGLSIVASLVDQLGGTITAQSSPGRGAGFSIQLPRI